MSTEKRIDAAKSRLVDLQAQVKGLLKSERKAGVAVENEATESEAETVRFFRLKGAGIPRRYWGGFSTFDAARRPEHGPLVEVALSWVERQKRLKTERSTFGAPTPSRQGLSMSGATGCGKSHLAAAVAGLCIEAKISLLWVNVAELVGSIKASWSPSEPGTTADIVNELTQTDILVLDDLGIEPPKDWVLDILYLIINRRYEDGTTLIWTSNYDGAQLRDRWSAAGDTAARIISRLAEMVKSVGKFPEVDLRKENGAGR